MHHVWTLRREFNPSCFFLSFSLSFFSLSSGQSPTAISLYKLCKYHGCHSNRISQPQEPPSLVRYQPLAPPLGLRGGTLLAENCMGYWYPAVPCAQLEEQLSQNSLSINCFLRSFFLSARVLSRIHLRVVGSNSMLHRCRQAQGSNRHLFC